jgi:hypothetical protein
MGVIVAGEGWMVASDIVVGVKTTLSGTTIEVATPTVKVELCAGETVNIGVAIEAMVFAAPGDGDPGLGTNTNGVAVCSLLALGTIYGIGEAFGGYTGKTRRVVDLG